MPNISTIAGNMLHDSGVNLDSLQPILTNPVTGTGSSGTVPKFTGTSTLGNSLITDNGSNALYNGSILATQAWISQQGYVTGGPFVQNVLNNSGDFNLNVSGQQAFFRFSQGEWTNAPVSGNYSHVLSVNGASDNRTVQIYLGDVPGYLWWRPNQGGTWHPWERILTSNNYNSYAPTLSGGGASGTWPISISGNADSVDGYHATNAASGLAYYASNGYLYAPSWINVDNGGVFSNTNNAHLRPNSGSYGSWLVTGSRNSWRGFEFDSGNNGNVVLMINTSSNTTGFHNNSYGWQFYWESGSLYVLKNAYGGGTQALVLDSSNYNSYAPTLTGGGASGTWGINVTGSAGYTQTLALTNLGNGSVNVNNGNSAVYRNENGAGAAVAYAPLLHLGGGDTMWQIQGTYGSSGSGVLYFRQGYSGSWGTWLTMLSSANYNSYAPTLTGGNASGTWGINITGSAGTLDGLDSTDFMRNYGMLDNTDVYVNFRVMRNSNSSSANDGMYIGYGNTNSGVTRIFGGGSTSDALIKYSNYTVEPGSFRAPIFYDSENTNYYVDPNSLSSQSSILIGTSGLSTSYGGAATGKIYFGSSGSDSPTYYHITTNMENYGGNYSKLDFKWYTGQRFYAHYGYGGFRFKEITNENTLFSVGEGDANVRVSNILYADQVRATIFYDSDDTSYYLNPNSTGTSLYVAGLVSTTRSSGTYFSANGASDDTMGFNPSYGTYIGGSQANSRYLYSGNSSYSGPLWYDGSIRTILHSGNYNSYAPTLTGGGASGTWSINISGNAATSSVAYNLQAADATQIRFNTVTNTDYSTMTFMSRAWSAVQGANGLAYNFTTHTNSGSGGYGAFQIFYGESGYVFAPTSFRAPIFYDSDNTAYYANFADTGTSINIAGSVNAATYNKPGLLLNASGTSSSGAAFGMQQVTAEGWTGIFVDYEPYTGWGLYHDNPANYFLITSETSTGSFGGGFTVPSRSSGNRTAYVKHRFDQNNGDFIAGGNIYMTGGTLVATQSWVNSQGFATGGPFVPVSGGVNMTGSYGLNDSRLYLRTNGDTNHYLWNASDDWEELGAYAGTGFRVTSNNGANGLLYVYGSSNGGYTYSPYSFRAPIFYDSENTGYYFDGNGGTNLNYLNVNGNWGGSPFGTTHAQLTITGTYASMYQTATNGSLGYWLTHIAIDGTWNLYGGRGAVNGSDWDWSMRAWPNQDGSYVEFRTSARAPIFYDSNDITYYADFASTSNSGIRLRGGMLIGPNTTWGAYLQVGGNGHVSSSYANVVTTDGNLHLDSASSKAMYLNYYVNGTIYLNGTTYYISSNGSYYNGRSEQVTVNYNNDSNSTYQLLWGSGNSVYGTAQVYVNPSSDIIYARGGYISPGNAWGTADSAFFPNGITTAGGTNWVYGSTYIGNAPGNGSGSEISSVGSFYFRNGNTSGTWGYAGLYVDRNNAANNYVPYSFEDEYGNHSWGIVARFHIQTAGQDKPSIQFTSAGSNDRWSLGYCSGSDFQFRITQNQGYRTDNSGQDGWGTERFRIATDGTVNIPGGLLTYSYQGNGNVGGTGLASWHPSGIYCGSTMWQYGAQYKNNTGIYGILELQLNNGFIISQGGSNYGVFNSWVRLDGHYGFYSGTNNAHIYPNNGTYGSWMISGSRNSWQGIEFNSGSAGNVTLMVQTDSNTSGFHNNSYGWQIRWYNGTLYIGKNSYGGNEATVLDSSNYTSYAAQVNGNVSNTFNVYQLSYAATTFNPSHAPRTQMNPMSVKMWQNYFNGTGLGSDYGTVMQYYSLSGHVDSQVYFDASGETWYRTASYDAGWQSWKRYLTDSNSPYAWNMNQYVRTSDNPTFGNIYSNGWFRNNNNNQGLYNENTTQYWSSKDNGYWDASSTTSVSSIRFWTGGHISSLRGYVYANTSNEIGFLNNGGSWIFRMTSGGDSYTTGNAYIGRHIDAQNTWGNCGCTTIFVGWSTAKVMLGNGNTGAHDWANDRPSNSVVSTMNHYFYNNIYAREDVVAYWSDARLKTNVKPIENALEKINKIGGYFYTPNQLAFDLDATKDMSERVGVMAQEIEEVLPHVVKPAPFNGDYKTVQYEKLVPLLIQGIKEQQKQIDELKSKLK